MADCAGGRPAQQVTHRISSEPSPYVSRETTGAALKIDDPVLVSYKLTPKAKT